MGWGGAQVSRDHAGMDSSVHTDQREGEGAPGALRCRIYGSTQLNLGVPLLCLYRCLGGRAGEPACVRHALAPSSFRKPLLRVELCKAGESWDLLVGRRERHKGMMP